MIKKKGIPIGYLFSAAGGAQRASSSYNHLILKELILHYKDKLEQERGCEFVPKQSYGRIIAANLLQVPLEKIPTTNNHLESFNSELKGNLKHELQIQLKERYKSYVPFLPEERIQLEYHYRQLVYYTPDPNRDEAAKRICNEKKIIQVEFNGQTLYLWIVSDTSTQLEPKIYNYSIAS
ncbi:unnamed protein product [Rhizophagus irregularis]|nr:unnamed protein product [Rhizophagus irregularis]